MCQMENGASLVLLLRAAVGASERIVAPLKLHLSVENLVTHEKVMSVNSLLFSVMDFDLRWGGFRHLLSVN